MGPVHPDHSVEGLAGSRQIQRNTPTIQWKGMFAEESTGTATPTIKWKGWWPNNDTVVLSPFSLRLRGHYVLALTLRLGLERQLNETPTTQWKGFVLCSTNIASPTTQWKGRRMNMKPVHPDHSVEGLAGYRHTQRNTPTIKWKGMFDEESTDTASPTTKWKGRWMNLKPVHPYHSVEGLAGSRHTQRNTLTIKWKGMFAKESPSTPTPTTQWKGRRTNNEIVFPPPSSRRHRKHACLGILILRTVSGGQNNIDIPSRAHTPMHLCAHALMRSCAHALMHLCTHALMHSCTHALMHSCTHAFMHL